ncbi:hypothetical protein BO79DRAFT_60891 [Aspergillus costaricaensis CBS 115574]|uniref:Uncharacterized protein n=1 Tax=Aspergillus costaricaensis CBS 115574 TaxID=1448317 RepID=A0ACD1I1M4_9EURO|nr:hypothetical protein BO79DRAFT_60891 [Aspergillus costaricaensis CBS 115574]RAK83944.1 hypothetical protein BO79DRAFT_60891 [Aspergillus costaricaensis CBS 115574]
MKCATRLIHTRHIPASCDLVGENIFLPLYLHVISIWLLTSTFHASSLLNIYLSLTIIIRHSRQDKYTYSSQKHKEMENDQNWKKQLEFCPGRGL